MTDDKEKGTAHILIVDDEESLRLTFEMFLTRAGYGTVRTAATYQEALAAIRQQEFDLIISDIVLEGASGTDLLREIREAGIECPVVMITGFPNLETAAEAVRLGAFDYIPKPVNKEALLRFTRQALKQWRLVQEKKRLEADNKRFRHYLETVFRSVRDAIITVDNDLRIVQLNDTAREWLQSGKETELTLGTLAGELGEVCHRDVQKVLRSHEEVREHRAECVKPDGSERILSINAAPLQDGAGIFQGVVLVARDVTAEVETNGRGRRCRFHRFIGCSPAMQALYTLLENVGKVDTAVLITGESGTGKELAAEALHAESPRCNRPLVKVDCTAIPEELMESELFGHRKGSFTGADRDRMGRILQADGGTLFLDEIGDISPRMQLRLLRFLQEKTFYPVGRDQPIQVDVRVIAATNADLRQKVTAGTFREDLYFRLRVMEIKLPPLRERQECLPLLVTHFLSKFQEKLGKEISGISDQAMAALGQYHWPGNVRELEHVMERACIMCDGATMALEHFPEEIRGGGTKTPETAGLSRPPPAVPPPLPAVGMSEKERIIEALRQTDGNKAKAARLLAFDRSTLYRKIRAYGISDAVAKV
jgi:PAS domain S-box-containing protein